MTKQEYLDACKNLIERELKPTVPEVIPLVRFYCAQEEAEGLGGRLHSFVEDGNCEQADIEWHLEDAKNHCDELAIAICRVLLKMSMTQRRKIYGAGYEPPFEHTEPEHAPEPDFGEQPSPEKYFPMAQLKQISGDLPPIQLERLFKEGMCFRRENVLFKVATINNKKATVTLSVEGVFGAIAGVEDKS